MKAFKAFVCLIVAVFLLSTVAFTQSKESGALKGNIKLEDGNPVPGVLVSLKSDDVVGATKTTITNQDGEYRFVGLQPGTYSISASLEGFASAKQTGIAIHIGKIFSVDLVLKQGKITEEVEVVGKSSLVDVKDSSTASVELTSEFLQNIPNTQFAVDAVNMAPGVSNNVAYGASQNTGINYQIDGVNVSDPAQGAAWVFLDYNVIDEVSVSGIGANAEYGGFSGVVFNTVTKSGGNMFKGYGEMLYQSKRWSSSNSDEFSPSEKDFYSAHFDIGGPIKKDKLSFFAAFLYYREIETLSGTTYDRDYKQPKGFLKFTWTPTAKTRINTFVEYDQYNGSGRGGDANTDYDATRTQKSPELVLNVSGQHLFSDYTFMEAKIGYFWGYYALEPVNGRDVSGHIDWNTGHMSKNSYYYYRADRTRLQGNFAVTHHADNFIKGSHDFKFGADLLFCTQRDQYGFNGGAYYYDIDGEPFLKEAYGGYDIHAKMDSYSAYVQDSWSVTPRLTINPGFRLDYSRGYAKDRPDKKFVTKPSFAPRIGFSFDIFGDHSTALKAHYGKYYEGSYIYAITSLSTAKGDRDEYYWDSELGQFVLDPSMHVTGGIANYDIDKKVKQAYMNQFTVGIERQLMKDVSLGITYITRKNFNHIAAVNIGATYEQVDWTNPVTGQTIKVWSQTSDASDNYYLITNPEKGQLSWMQYTPYRKYNGIEVLLNKRFSKNWQAMVSYVYSKTQGNFNNGSSTATGVNTTFQNPNNQINAEGRLTFDPTHMLKIQGSVILPIDINLNINFQLITGDTYTQTVRLPYSVDINRTTIFAEKRGTYRYDTSKTLDLRLEKTFKFRKFKVGLLMDIFNVFNEGVIDSVTTINTNFGSPLSITAPRTFRAGLRFWL